MGKGRPKSSSKDKKQPAESPEQAEVGLRSQHPDASAVRHHFIFLGLWQLQSGHSRCCCYHIRLQGAAHARYRNRGFSWLVQARAAMLRDVMAIASKGPSPTGAPALKKLKASKASVQSSPGGPPLLTGFPVGPGQLSPSHI